MQCMVNVFMLQVSKAVNQSINQSIYLMSWGAAIDKKFSSVTSYRQDLLPACKVFPKETTTCIWFTQSQCILHSGVGSNVMLIACCYFLLYVGSDAKERGLQGHHPPGPALPLLEAFLGQTASSAWPSQLPNVSTLCPLLLLHLLICCLLSLSVSISPFPKLAILLIAAHSFFFSSLPASVFFCTLCSFPESSKCKLACVSS